MAKDSKTIIASTLDEQTLHGLMANQAARLEETAEAIKQLFATYGCSDFNAAYNAFSNNSAAGKEFKGKRNELIEQLKQIVTAMDAIKDSQEG